MVFVEEKESATMSNNQHLALTLWRQRHSNLRCNHLLNLTTPHPLSSLTTLRQRVSNTAYKASHQTHRGSVCVCVCFRLTSGWQRLYLKEQTAQAKIGQVWLGWVERGGWVAQSVLNNGKKTLVIQQGGYHVNIRNAAKTTVSLVFSANGMSEYKLSYIYTKAVATAAQQYVYLAGTVFKLRIIFAVLFRLPVRLNMSPLDLESNFFFFFFLH